MSVSDRDEAMQRQAGAVQRRYDTPPQGVLLPSRRSAADDHGEPTTYYNRPMIHSPTWHWYIPMYFFLGGIAGGAALVGAMAQLFGGPRHRSTVRHARWLAIVLAAICPLPLIWDLGRRERFHHMLRVVKVSSPLNLGTWILSGFSLVSGMLVARQAAEDSFIVRRESVLGRLARAIPAGPLTALQAFLGICLGGYTGTLLAVTAVPLWAAAGVLLGPLFLATAVASGAAALLLIAILTGSDTAATRRDVEAVESVAALVQISSVAAREALVPARINAPLRHGFWGRLYQFGAVGGGMGGPLLLRFALRLSGRRVGRAMQATAATLTLLGALAERFAITEAGKISARDPLAYQALTRGEPGEVRSTPAEQARRSANAAPSRERVAASDI